MYLPVCLGFPGVTRPGLVLGEKGNQGPKVVLSECKEEHLRCILSTSGEYLGELSGGRGEGVLKQGGHFTLPPKIKINLNLN